MPTEKLGRADLNKHDGMLINEKMKKV